MSKVYVLRGCAEDGSSQQGFKYPLVIGERVTAPEFDTSLECGKGLHGFRNGVGDIALLCGSLFQVYECDANDVTETFSGKCKFRTGVLVFQSHEIRECAKFIYDNDIREAIMFVTATAGNYGTATAGDQGTATAGDYGTATAGDQGTATAGYKGTATAGNYGTATAGDEGTATAGDYGTATAGYNGTATAGDYGTATAGYKGTATAGYKGTATAGDEGVISILYWNGEKYKRVIGVVGEDGILPNVPYVVVHGNLVRKEQQ